MKTLKKVWFTERGDEIWSMTLESNSLVSHEKLRTNEMEFPAKEPNRHTTCLSLLGYSDLFLLYEEIGKLLESVS